jgi:hypothetical protein
MPGSVAFGPSSLGSYVLAPAECATNQHCPNCPPSPSGRLCPAADYYGGSAPCGALAASWPTPGPESAARFSSSWREHRHVAEGSACTPDPVRDRARRQGDGGASECPSPIPQRCRRVIRTRRPDDSTLARPVTGGPTIGASDSGFFRSQRDALASGPGRGRALRGHIVREASDEILLRVLPPALVATCALLTGSPR